MSTAKNQALKVAVIAGGVTTTLMLTRTLIKGELSTSTVIVDLGGGVMGAVVLYFWERWIAAKGAAKVPVHGVS